MKNKCFRLFKKKIIGWDTLVVTCIFKKCYKEVIQAIKPGLCPREGNNPDTDVQKVVSLFWKPASLGLLCSESPGPRLLVIQELAGQWKFSRF